MPCPSKEWMVQALVKFLYPYTIRVCLGWFDMCFLMVKCDIFTWLMRFGAVSSGCIALSWWCSPTQRVHYVVLCFKIGSHPTFIFYFICDQICPYLGLVGNQIVDYTRVHAWKPRVQSRTWPTFLLWRKSTGVTVYNTSQSLYSSCWKAFTESNCLDTVQNCWTMEGRQSLTDYNNT